MDWVVLTAAILGLTFAAMGIIGGGAEVQTQRIVDATEYTVDTHRHFGRTALDRARDVDRSFYGSDWVDRRMDTLMNTLTDRQLRNQHRVWSERAGDPTDPRHNRAADQLALLDIAMDARGVAPN